MTLQERIVQDLTAAMKAKDAARLSTLRMVKSALMNREIKNREEGKPGPLADNQVMDVLRALVKQRRDSVEQFRQGGRLELAEKEAAEIKVIDEYLPAAVDEATLVRVVDEVVAEIGAQSPKDMGRVMKAVMAKLAGQTVDGKLLSQMVKARLGG